MKRIGLLLLLLLSLSACAKKSPYTEVQLPPQRVVLHGFSLLPFNEPGWVSIKGKDELMLSRYAGSLDETQVIMANAIQLPLFRSREELRHYFKQTMVDDIYSGRYELISHTVDDVDHESATCVRSHLVNLDRYPINFVDDKPMRLESYQQLCIHPDVPQVGILVEYAQQHYPGHGDPAFTDKAFQLLNSLRFLQP